MDRQKKTKLCDQSRDFLQMVRTEKTTSGFKKLRNVYYDIRRESVPCELKKGPLIQTKKLIVARTRT